MLTDHATINVRGGRGGAGCVSLRREKHVPKGGPDGGDGGRGGDVVLRASRQVRDLTYFRHHVHFKGRSGGHGQGQKRHGHDGDAVVATVPVGTQVRDRDGLLIADLVHEGQSVVVAVGGEGGRGNTCFVSSRRRVPRFAERGLEGDERWIELTLKLIADVGLVGLPNAGKSSLLAALTRAHPKIAAYPFTTLEPNLGTLVVDDTTIVLADIPGLVAGASEGTGLGDRFLAHIERTRALVYVVDVSGGSDAVVAALHTVARELGSFSADLGARPAVVALNKTDLADPDDVTSAVGAVASLRRFAGAPVLTTSAVVGEGLESLAQALLDLLRRADARMAAELTEERAVTVLRPGGERVGDYSVERDGEAWRVRGAALERLVAKADLDNDEAVRYLQEVMEHAGLSKAVRHAGGADGDTIVIGDSEFELA
jgi:GTP-binding protein